MEERGRRAPQRLVQDDAEPVGHHEGAEEREPVGHEQPQDPRRAPLAQHQRGAPATSRKSAS